MKEYSFNSVVDSYEREVVARKQRYMKLKKALDEEILAHFKTKRKYNELLDKYNKLKESLAMEMGTDSAIIE